MKNIPSTAIKIAIITALVYNIFYSCQSPEKPAIIDKASIKMEVRKMFDEYHLAIKKEGLTGEFKFFDTSDDFFWVPPGYTSALRYDSIVTILKNNAGLFQAIDFHWDTLNIIPLSPTIANFTGIVGGTMIDTAGNSSSVSIIETGIAIKRKDGWKLLSGQSANMPERN